MRRIPRSQERYDQTFARDELDVRFRSARASGFIRGRDTVAAAGSCATPQRTFTAGRGG